MTTLHCLNPDCQIENPVGANFCYRCGTPFLLKQRYQCDRTLGKGGFGRTYLAHDSDRHHTRVVVKQFIPTEDLRNHQEALEKALSLFGQESKRLLQLDQHPQIPTLFEAFQANNSHYLVQQFIEGHTLAELLAKRSKPFTEAQVRAVLLNLLPVLHFIHSHNIIHRDIKPENVIQRNSDKRLVLIDFGAAKAVTRTLLANTGTTIGSAGYVAPEQIYGKAVFASDLYSLGVMCLHLLTQVKPCDLYDTMDGTFRWRTFLKGQRLSPELSTVLDRLTQTVVRDRYRTAQDALMAVLGKKMPGVPPNVTAAPSLTTYSTVRSPTTIQGTALQPNPSELKSEKGVNYQKLRELLQAGKWKEADWETNWRMLQAIGRKEDDFMRPGELKTFPCQDLNTIDYLWVHYSHGQFGFSVQQQIYQECGGTLHEALPRDRDDPLWQRFGDRIGWRKDGNWLEYSKLIPSASSPQGMFPLGFAWGGWPAGFAGTGQTWVSKLLYSWVFLFARLATCKQP